MIRSICFCFLCLLGVNYAFSQSSDSLLTLLKKESDNKKKINLCNQLAFAFRNIDSAKVVRYTSEAIALSKSENYPQGLVDAYYHLGWVIMLGGNYAKATDMYAHSLTTAKKIVYLKGEANAYNGLAAIQYKQARYHKALDYYKKSLKVKQKLGNEQSLATAYNNLGVISMRLGDYPKALKYYAQTLKIMEKRHDSHTLALSYSNVGAVYQKQGAYDQAFDYYIKSLKMSKSLGSKNGIAIATGKIGEMYYHQKNYDQALVYHLRALDIIQQTNNEAELAQIYFNIANTYDGKKDYAEALKYHFNSLRIQEKLNNRNGIAESYHGLGVTYHKLTRYGIALDYFEKALVLQQQMKTKTNIASTLEMLGKIHYEVKHYQKAADYLNRGILLAQKVNAMVIVKNGAQTLAKVYEVKGDYKKAYQMHILYKNTSDSLLGKENTRNITRLEMSYAFKQEKDSLRKEHEIQAGKLEKEKLFSSFQRNMNILVVIILLGVIVFAVYIFRNHRTQKQLNTQLTTQKDRLATLNYQLSQTQEETVLQRDMLADNNHELLHYRTRIEQSFQAAQLIQNAFLPTMHCMQQMFAEYFVLYKPKDVVSGDFYRVLRLDNKRVMLMVADCTGHGVPGAFMTLISNNLLDKIVKVEKITEPDKVLTRLHEEIQVALHQKDIRHSEGGMDGVILVIEKVEEQHKITFAGAKNNMLYFDRESRELGKLKGTRKSVGGFQLSNKQFEKQEVLLPSNNIIYLGSDGFADQNDESRKKFGNSRLISFLKKQAHLPLSEQQECLETALREHQKNAEQRDDILLVGVRL